MCELHQSSWQCQILNPLSKARDQSHNLMVPSWIHFSSVTKGTPLVLVFFFYPLCFCDVHCNFFFVCNFIDLSPLSFLWVYLRVYQFCWSFLRNELFISLIFSMLFCFYFNCLCSGVYNLFSPTHFGFCCFFFISLS